MWGRKAYNLQPSSLSHCHTKRRVSARGCAIPSFSVTPTFSEVGSHLVSSGILQDLGV